MPLKSQHALLVLHWYPLTDIHKVTKNHDKVLLSNQLHEFRAAVLLFQNDTAATPTEYHHLQLL
jgi:hypothetical protein